MIYFFTIKERAANGKTTNSEVALLANSRVEAKAMFKDLLKEYEAQRAIVNSPSMKQLQFSLREKWRAPDPRKSPRRNGKPKQKEGLMRLIQKIYQFFMDSDAILLARLYRDWVKFQKSGARVSPIHVSRLVDSKDRLEFPSHHTDASRQAQGHFIQPN